MFNNINRTKLPDSCIVRDCTERQILVYEFCYKHLMEYQTAVRALKDQPTIAEMINAGMFSLPVTGNLWPESGDKIESLNCIDASPVVEWRCTNCKRTLLMADIPSCRCPLCDGWLNRKD